MNTDIAKRFDEFFEKHADTLASYNAQIAEPFEPTNLIEETGIDPVAAYIEEALAMDYDDDDNFYSELEGVSSCDLPYHSGEDHDEPASDLEPKTAIIVANVQRVLSGDESAARELDENIEHYIFCCMSDSERERAAADADYIVNSLELWKHEALEYRYACQAELDLDLALTSEHGFLHIGNGVYGRDSEFLDEIEAEYQARRSRP